MHSKHYQSIFDRTIADTFFPQHVNPVYIGALLRERHKSAAVADAVKRALYYGKTDRLNGNVPANVEDLPFNIDRDILHAILGMESEMAEITEAALNQDRAKIIDEAGDYLWYLSLLFRQFQIDFEEVFGKNIDKLRKRYPDQFTLELAVNRDLEAEQAVFN